MHIILRNTYELVSYSNNRNYSNLRFGRPEHADGLQKLIWLRH